MKSTVKAMGFNKNKPRLWLTWNPNCRRSHVLAEQFGFELMEFALNSNPVTRQILGTLWTIRILFLHRPSHVIVQHSLLLSLTAAAFKRCRLGVKMLIIDAHTHSLLREMDSFLQPLYKAVKAFALRSADLVLVTNRALQTYVEEQRGRGYILPDKIPNFPTSPREEKRLSGTFTVVFICSYSPDEPLREVLKAARRLSGDYRIYITGKLKKNRLNGLAVPDNVILTDFLSEPDYIKLLSSSDAIVVLTNTDNCMVCGAYEAVALGKPLILSNKKVLRDYFFQGVIFTENTPQHLAESIMRAIAEKTSLEADIKDLKAVLEQSWAEQSEALYEKLHGKEAFKKVPS